MDNCCVKHTNRTDSDKKDLMNRLNRLIGQMNGIKAMIEDDRYCGDVLIQLSAINSGVKSLANLLLEKHLSSCVVRDVQDGKVEVMEEVMDMVRRFQ